MEVHIVAKATKTIVQPIRTEEARRADAFADLQAAMADNTEALANLVKLAALLQQSGVLDIVNAFLGQRKAIVHQLVEMANQPGNTSGIKTVIALAQGLGQLDAEALGKTMQAASAGLKAMVESPSEERPIGIFELLRILKEPDVSAGLQRGVSFLKGMGEALSSKDEPTT